MWTPALHCTDPEPGPGTGCARLWPECQVKWCEGEGPPPPWPRLVNPRPAHEGALAGHSPTTTCGIAQVVRQCAGRHPGRGSACRAMLPRLTRCARTPCMACQSHARGAHGSALADNNARCATAQDRASRCTAPVPPRHPRALWPWPPCRAPRRLADADADADAAAAAPTGRRPAQTPTALRYKEQCALNAPGFPHTFVLKTLKIER